MNGIDCIADTNGLLYILSGNPCVDGILDLSLGISVITEMELLGFKGITAPEIRLIKSMLRECEILPVTTLIKEATIRLKQKNGVKLPDAIIASTAKVNGLPLISADKGFLNIPDLNFILLTP